MPLTQSIGKSRPASGIGPISFSGTQSLFRRSWRIAVFWPFFRVWYRGDAQGFRKQISACYKSADGNYSHLHHVLLSSNQDVIGGALAVPVGYQTRKNGQKWLGRENGLSAEEADAMKCVITDEVLGCWGVSRFDMPDPHWGDLPAGFPLDRSGLSHTIGPWITASTSSLTPPRSRQVDGASFKLVLAWGIFCCALPNFTREKSLQLS